MTIKRFWSGLVVEYIRCSIRKLNVGLLSLYRTQFERMERITAGIERTRATMETVVDIFSSGLFGFVTGHLNYRAVRRGLTGQNGNKL